ncbi:M20 family metallopeptidase [Nocardioides alcanivorans]|uniref:M20 family metallopeptidase n=1 Tax=Nocardioides alcanivorans TaxID=2897352 RepID=UPI00201330E9
MTTDQRDHEDLVGAVMAEATRDRLLETVCGLVDIPSPTGAERPISEWIAGRLGAVGLNASAQVIDDRQANAAGVLRGPEDGKSLLLYAPLDTFTTGDPALDLPWAGSTMRADMLPQAKVYDDLVVGLAAGNPKGHVAAIMVAVEALSRSGVPLPGDVVAGFGAGGMPSFAVPGAGVSGRENTGHGVGATFLLERGFTTDHAVIAKPGWNVSHEEVGLVWIDVEVPGLHSYVGSRDRLPYRNATAVAAAVIERLETWFDEYAGAHEVGSMRPQGVVSSVVGGFERLAASTSASVRLRLDVRMTPDQTAPEVVREVRAQLRALSEELEVPIRARQIAAVPGTRTARDSEIVRATTQAWERVAGRSHELILANSGATDANILRLRGVPTARVGMPKVMKAPDGGPVDFTLGMNIVDVQEMRRLVEVLVRTTLTLRGGAETRKNG